MTLSSKLLDLNWFNETAHSLLCQILYISFTYFGEINITDDPIKSDKNVCRNRIPVNNYSCAMLIILPIL